MITATTNLTANVAAVQRFWQGFNTHELDIWDEVCTCDFVNHAPGLLMPTADLGMLKATMARLLFDAFPDLQSLEQDLIVDGDKVVTRYILRGTHQGEFMRMAPTGKPISAGGMGLSHLRNGKIKEQWIYVNTLGLLQQIGASLG